MSLLPVMDTNAKHLAKALAITTQLFEKIPDKNGAPYALHCIAVMMGVADRGYEVMAAAAMHDLIEDTHMTLSWLSDDHEFSPRIVQLVEIMTKRQGEEYEDYIDRVMCDCDAIAIKLSDLRHNSDIRRLPDISVKSGERLVKYAAAYKKLEESDTWKQQIRKSYCVACFD